MMFTSHRYRDRLGKPVPSRLTIVWRGRERLEEMRTELHKWRGSLAGGVAGSMSPQSSRVFSAFQGVPTGKISVLVKQIDDLLTSAIPQVVCQCKELYCPFCEGKGWLNASDARRISSQGQQPALLASLSQRPLSQAASPSAGQTLESETLRLLWLLGGPPGRQLACGRPGDCLGVGGAIKFSNNVVAGKKQKIITIEVEKVTIEWSSPRGVRQ